MIKTRGWFFQTKIVIAKEKHQKIKWLIVKENKTVHISAASLLSILSENNRNFIHQFSGLHS
jgi:hypothetical protein